MNQLSDKFITAMANIVIAHVDLDEQHQRTEKVMEPEHTAASHADNKETK